MIYTFLFRHLHLKILAKSLTDIFKSYSYEVIFEIVHHAVRLIAMNISFSRRCFDGIYIRQFDR